MYAATVVWRRLEGALGVAGDALTTLAHLDRRASCSHGHLGPRLLARHKTEASNLDVIVDADPRDLPFCVFVARLR